MMEMNVKLEEERKLLLTQLQTLMNQLQQLLTELISSKDTYANQQKSYLSVVSHAPIPPPSSISLSLSLSLSLCCLVLPP